MALVPFIIIQFYVSYKFPSVYHRQQNTLYLQSWQILRSEFIASSTRLPQIKDLPSIIGCEPIRNFKKLFLQMLAPLG